MTSLTVDTPRRPTTLRRLCLVAATLTLATACSGDDDSADDSPTTTEAESTTSTPTVEDLPALFESRTQQILDAEDECDVADAMINLPPVVPTNPEESRLAMELTSAFVTKAIDYLKDNDEGAKAETLTTLLDQFRKQVIDAKYAPEALGPTNPIKSPVAADALAPFHEAVAECEGSVS